jgi:hypothetical protein
MFLQVVDEIAKFVRMAERIKKGDHGDFLHQDISSHL